MATGARRTENPGLIKSGCGEPVGRRGYKNFINDQADAEAVYAGESARRLRLGVGV